MRSIVAIGVGVLVLGAVAMSAQAATYTIAPDKVEAQKIYFGSPKGFDKPGKVDYEKVIKATPEYLEVRKKKIQVGTGKYWILLSQASDRAVRAIAEVGQETDYDLIAASGYLASLEPAISAEDVTELVLDKLSPEKKKKLRQ